MVDIKQQLGKNIRKFRTDRGLTREKMAEKIGISPNGLGNIERGEVFMSLANIEKLIDVLQIEPYELFIFSATPAQNVVFDDVVKKIEKYKDDNRRLYIIAEILDLI